MPPRARTRALHVTRYVRTGAPKLGGPARANATGPEIFTLMKSITNAPSGQLGCAPSMRDRAVDLARMGFRVFKLKVGDKTPDVSKPYDVASSDPGVVHRVWTNPVNGESVDNNIGVACGNGLMVLDVDVKNGKPGMQSLEFLEDMGLPIDGLRVRTPSGGIHVYLEVPPDTHIPNSVEKIAAGVDVRGHHGYVVGAGSVVGGIEYVFVGGVR